jgi:hypothetical protein
VATFEVPASKASVKQNRFEFKIPGEKKTYSLPLLQYLTNGLKDPLVEVMRRVAPLVENGNGDIPQEDALKLDAATKTIFETLAPGAYGSMDGEQVKAVIEAWTAASNTTVGKS